MGLTVGSLNADLTLNLKQFMESMTAAVGEVKSFGQQLQDSLSGATAQSFTSLNKRLTNLQKKVDTMSQSMEALGEKFQKAKGQDVFTQVAKHAKEASAAVNSLADATSRAANASPRKKSTTVTTASEPAKTVKVPVEAPRALGIPPVNVLPSGTQAIPMGGAALPAIRMQEQLAMSLTRVSAAYERVRSSAQQASQGFRRASQEARQAGTSAQSAGNQAQNAGRKGAEGAERVELKLRNTRKEVDRLNNQLSGFGKNMFRIFSGIMISQGFYRIANGIEEAARSIMSFENNMRNATIAMSYLLDRSQDAQIFIEMLKDFAAVTPYTTEEAIEMARTLMAMGVAATNVKSVMQTLTDASAAMGLGADVVQRITWSIGQILSTGKLSGQEIRELGKAGIPIMKILQEELGLTAKQLRNIGDLSIKGETAVTAILTGLRKRYAGASKDLSNTLTGMWSTIKDDFLIISDQLFKGAYNRLTEFVRGIRNAFERARSVINTKGIGGLFEAFVPKDMQQPIRRFVASIKQLGASLRQLFVTFRPILAEIGKDTLNKFTTIATVVGKVAQTIADLARQAMSSSPVIRQLIVTIGDLVVGYMAAQALRWLWTAVGLGKICATVATAVRGLSRAINGLTTALTANPIMIGISMIVGGLFLLAMSIETTYNWLLKLEAAISGFFSFSTAGILEPQNLAGDSAEWQRYNKDFSDWAGGLDKIGDSAQSAGRKIKEGFLAAFDEVFTIPDPNAGGGGGGGFDGNYTPPPPPPEPPTGDPNDPDGIAGNPDSYTQVGEAAEKVLTPLEKLKAFIDGINQGFDDGVAKFEAWAGGIYDSVATWIGGAIEDIGEWFADLGENIGQWVVDTALGIGEWSSGVGEKIIQFVTDVGTWFADLPKNLLQIGKDLLSKLWEGITGGESTLSTNIGGTTGNITASFAGILANVLVTGASLLPKLWEGITSKADILKTNIGTQITNIKDWFNGVLEKVKTVGGGVLSYLWTGITSGTTTLKTNIDAKINSIRDWINLLPAKAKNVGNTVLSNLWSGITSGTETLKKNVDAKVNSVRDWFNGLLTKVKSVGNSVLSNLWSGITSGTETIKKNIGSKVNSIRDWFNEILGKVKSVGSNILPNIWSGVSGATTSLKNNFSSLVSTITGWFGEYGSFGFLSKWRNIGDNIVDGIWAGVNNAKAWLKEKLKGFASWLPQWIRDALGISSPAKVMIPIGDFSVQGIGVGFEKAMPALYKDVDNYMNAFQQHVANASVPVWAATQGMGNRLSYSAARSSGSDSGMLGATLSALNQLLAQIQSGALQPLMVGTLIGDDRSYNVLAQKIRTIQSEQSFRSGRPVLAT